LLFLAGLSASRTPSAQQAFEQALQADQKHSLQLLSMLADSGAGRNKHKPTCKSVLETISSARQPVLLAQNTERTWLKRADRVLRHDVFDVLRVISEFRLSSFQLNLQSNGKLAQHETSFTCSFNANNLHKA
jgi:hypothetical protein